jgi:HSP20 family molecular chaperone IbpA
MEHNNPITKTPAEQVAGAEQTRCGRCYRPDVDILEHGDELLVLADVPGAKNDSIDVRFEDGTLEIRAAVTPREHNGETCLLHEYGVGDYYRSFQVSEAVDAAKISADYADGVLTLHLPKSEAVKPRKIAVAAK